MVFEELVLKKIQTVSAADGEYAFGANQDTTRVYMCHSNQNGYKIYEAQPKKAFRIIYSTETEINRRIYGEPEAVWADGDTQRILLKTMDKSLHLIHDKKKIWSKPYGLSSIIKTFTFEDKLIVSFY